MLDEDWTFVFPYIDGNKYILIYVIDYKIYPQNCTAYDGGWAVVNKQVKNVTLWTYKK